MPTKTLGDILAESTKEGELYEKLPDGKLRCYACGLKCPIPEGKMGVCRVRFNKGGKLFVPSGYVAALNADPIEKKPFFHVLPGSEALSFGMLGCDFHCSFCQNWISSQALRDPEAGSSISKIGKEEMVQLALDRRCISITSTYNEPLITSEWAVEIFKEAKKHGLITGYVSNGNATPEVLDYLRPHMDLFKVDLKCFSDKSYRELGGTLENTRRSIRAIYARGFWMELVTLLIPGMNDSADEIRQLTEFIVSVSPEIPWHVTAFHPDYNMTDGRGTTAGDLLKAADIGKKSGLRFIYTGNLPGMIEEGENTYCPNCRELLIKRFGFRILEDRISETNGQCPKCRAKIPGVWSRAKSA